MMRGSLCLIFLLLSSLSSLVIAAVIDPAERSQISSLLSLWSTNTLPEGWSFSNLDNVCNTNSSFSPLWNGLVCDDAGHITSFTFSARNPSEFFIFPYPLRRLHKIEVINLRDMNWQWTHLPFWLNELRRLKTLRVMRTKGLLSPLPSLIDLEDLRELKITNSDLDIDFPVDLLRIPNLVVLDLSGNSINGAIDYELLLNSTIREVKLTPSNITCLTSADTDILSRMEHQSIHLLIDYTCPQITWPSQSSALKELYEQFRGCHMMPSDDMIQDACVRDLNRVECSQGYVTSIQLQESFNASGACQSIVKLKELFTLSIVNMNLTGNIDILCQLKGLQDLDLSRNQLTAVPSCIFPSTSNSISLSGNSIRRLPKICNISVVSLDLSHNDIKFFPQCQRLIGSGIFFKLNLSHNRMSGKLNHFRSWAKGSLSIDLSHNRYSSALPLDVWDIFQKFAGVSLGHSDWRGNVPKVYGDLYDKWTLLSVDLSNNRISGDIPNFPGIMNLIDVRYNPMMSGRIPQRLSPSRFGQSLLFNGTGLTCPNERNWKEAQRAGRTDACTFPLPTTSSTTSSTKQTISSSTYNGVASTSYGWPLVSSLILLSLVPLR
ncbi:Receptor-like protein kinase [Planoprotostelium fungivorum]|uniref:Receptor-like protein kinase n=1 Tax=Planoprotostelium fungivorum TaxID=1890364 RepID=A0A2P6MYV8_9EUKA|nr:Receptor-like protein kinase [Planoprotostelium fungivorum]